MKTKAPKKSVSKRTTVQKPPHFAIGLPVRIRDRATPAGWHTASMGRFADGTNWDKSDYQRTFQIQSVDDATNTFEVGGWWWNPTDLEIPYA
jgi:hypothetical protein